MLAPRPLVALRKALRSVVPMPLAVRAYNAVVRIRAPLRGLRVYDDAQRYRVVKGDKEIRLSKQQAIYLGDMVENFDFYFSAVQPIRHCSGELVDYSTPRWHSVRGFDDFPVLFPSYAEPVSTTLQYLDFAQLGEDAVVLDLGAYAGLTSILFDKAIPSGGRVVAVEADPRNAEACRKNLAAYSSHSNRTIELVEVAVWKHDRGVEFSSEGNMGSSATELVGAGRGRKVRVPSMTLLQLAKRCQMTRVDFIKCDIEGGETEVFDDPSFFDHFSPRIMIECHVVRGVSTETRCREVLSRHGYACQHVNQSGYPLPLLACTPPATRSGSPVAPSWSSLPRTP